MKKVLNIFLAFVLICSASFVFAGCDGLKWGSDDIHPGITHAGELKCWIEEQGEVRESGTKYAEKLEDGNDWKYNLNLDFKIKKNAQGGYDEPDYKTEILKSARAAQCYFTSPEIYKLETKDNKTVKTPTHKSLEELLNEGATLQGFSTYTKGVRTLKITHRFYVCSIIYSVE